MPQLSIYWANFLWPINHGSMTQDLLEVAAHAPLAPSHWGEEYTRLCQTIETAVAALEPFKDIVSISQYLSTHLVSKFMDLFAEVGNVAAMRQPYKVFNLTMATFELKQIVQRVGPAFRLTMFESLQTFYFNVNHIFQFVFAPAGFSDDYQSAQSHSGGLRAIGGEEIDPEHQECPFFEADSPDCMRRNGRHCCCNVCASTCCPMLRAIVSACSAGTSQEP